MVLPINMFIRDAFQRKREKCGNLFQHGRTPPPLPLIRELSTDLPVFFLGNFWSFCDKNSQKMEVGIGLTPPLLTKFPNFPFFVFCFKSTPYSITYSICTNKFYLWWRLANMFLISAFELLGSLIFCMVMFLPSILIKGRGCGWWSIAFEYFQSGKCSWYGVGAAYRNQIRWEAGETDRLSLGSQWQKSRPKSICEL